MGIKINFLGLPHPNNVIEMIQVTFFEGEVEKEITPDAAELFDELKGIEFNPPLIISRRKEVEYAYAEGFSFEPEGIMIFPQNIILSFPTSAKCLKISIIQPGIFNQFEIIY